MHDYIAKDSKYYAKKVTAELTKTTKKLTTFPEMGRVVPETDDPSIRELFLHSYRAIYRAPGKKVHVLAVIHAKRDILSEHREILCRK